MDRPQVTSRAQSFAHAKRQSRARDASQQWYGWVGGANSLNNPNSFNESRGVTGTPPKSVNRTREQGSSPGQLRFIARVGRSSRLRVRSAKVFIRFISYSVSAGLSSSSAFLIPVRAANAEFTRSLDQVALLEVVGLLE